MIKMTFLLSVLTLTLLLASCGSSNEAAQTKQSPQQSQSIELKEASKPANLRQRQAAAQQTSVTATTPAASKQNLVQFEVYDIKGNLRNSNEWIGKQPTVVNVWGTWCPPCRREIPDLVKLNSEYSGKGIALLGLAVRDTPQKVQKFAAMNKMDWLMMIGERNHLLTLGVTTGVPTTIFYNRDGKETQRFVGPRSYEVFKKAFEAIL
jgi:thiol-disulfide isomerase/thioredoxin